MNKFAGMVSPTNVSFTGIDGKNHVISTGHPNNERIRELMRETRAAYLAGDATKGEALWTELTGLADIPKSIAAASLGRVEVKDDEVYFMGEVLHNAITRRILWCIQESEDPTPYMKFLDNLMENPSKRAVDELFGFLEACNMGITDEGMILAYKRVRNDYMDIYSGTMRNAVGDVLTMPRNKVDENKDRTCSDGLHFCSFSYLPHFGAGSGNRVVILELNPRDVVAIPSDYNDAKGRACAYKVIGEYEGADIADILSIKPVWKPNDVRTNFGNDSYRRDEQSVLERFIEELEANDTRGDMDWGGDVNGDTTMGDIPFSVRSQIARIIEESFGGTYEESMIEDDFVTIQELIETVGDYDNDDLGDEGEEDHDEEHDEISDEPVEAVEPEGSDDSIAPRVKTVIAEHLGVGLSDVTDSATLMRDLGADSLDIVELVMAFEEEFGIDIGDDACAASSDKTVAETVTMLDALVNGTEVPVIQTSATVKSATAAPKPAKSGQTTVFIYPEQDGAETRWVAECPDCNEGSGWKQSYARKRDARRGIKRSLGDNVAIVERDV